MPDDATPPGWYQDPETPGSERRWNGSAWIGTPHKTPASPSLFGPEVERAYWTNANAPARVARWLGPGLLIAYIGISVLIIPVNADPRRLAIGAILVGVGMLFGIASIVCAALGIARGRAGAGALGLSVVVLATDSLFIVFTIAMVAIILILGHPL
jgi:hypothetical protein